MGLNKKKDDQSTMAWLGVVPLAQHERSQSGLNGRRGVLGRTCDSNYTVIAEGNRQ